MNIQPISVGVRNTSVGEGTRELPALVSLDGGKLDLRIPVRESGDGEVAMRGATVPDVSTSPEL